MPARWYDTRQLIYLAGTVMKLCTERCASSIADWVIALEAASVPANAILPTRCRASTHGRLRKNPGGNRACRSPPAGSTAPTHPGSDRRLSHRPVTAKHRLRHWRHRGNRASKLQFPYPGADHVSPSIPTKNSDSQKHNDFQCIRKLCTGKEDK